MVGFFVEQGYISRTLLDVTLYLIILGIPAVLIFMWFHGRPGRQRVGRGEAGLIAVLGLAAIAGSAHIAMRGGGVPAVVDPSEVVVDLGDLSVAVLPFENELTDPSMAWLDRGVSELLATDLAQVDSLRIVSGQRVIDLLRQELGEVESRTVPEGLRTRVTHLAGARYMLTGRIAGTPENVILIASLLDADTGEIAAGARQQGPDVFALVDAVSEELISAGLSSRLATTAVGPSGTSAMAPVAQMTTANLEAFAEYQRGLEARYRFDFQTAGEHFRRAVQLDSTFALAHFQLAGIQVQQGDFAGSAASLYAARQNLTHANERDRLFIEGLDTMIRGDLDEGERILRDLIARYPDEKEGRITLAAMKRGREGASAEVARLFEETLRLDPLYSIGYNELAYTEAQRGNLDSAIALVDRYVQLEPGEPNPLDSRGDVLRLAGRHEEARASYRSALAVDPGFTLALRHLATSYLQQDRAAEGLEELEPYLSSDEAHVRAVARDVEGQLHLWLGNLEEGLEALAAGVEAAEGLPGDHVNLLRILLFAHVQLGRFEEAEPLRRRMEELSPLEGSAEIAEIIAAGESGRFDDLDRVADMFVAKYRENPTLERFTEVATFMADLYRAFYRGDHERVVDLAAEAPFAQGETGTEYAGYPVMRSLLALGEGERAIPHVEVARRAGITGTPNQWDSLTRRILQYYEGRARELTGDRTGAISAYRELVDAWGDAVREVPLISDAAGRLAALEGA